MSSSLYKSPLRNSNSDVKLSLPSPQDSIPNLEFPKVNQNNSEKEPQSLEKIKNPLDNFISETKKFLWNSPKALEASYYLTATAITTLFLSPYQSLITGKSLAETRNEILQTVIEKGRNWCNKHLWCGSLLGKDEEFIKASDTTLQDNLNPFTWVGNSFISSLMYTVDWSRAESTRVVYNLITKKNISAEEFKTLEEADAVLHSLRVSSDLIKAGLSLILLKKLGPSEMRAWQPLIISSGMSLANAVGEKWQNNKTCLDIEVAEHTLSGVANSLLFMGTMRAGSKLYTNHGGKVFSLFGATSIDKNILSAHAKHVTEFYDLRDSIPDLVNTLHKARKELWDRDTDKKLNTWLIAGHILTVGSALTDTAELKMLDKLSATSEKHLNNQVHATKDRRKTTQSKTDAQLLDDEFEKLCKMGEATKGKVTAEIMSHTYDVLIKTAEYWQKNGVKFNFGFSQQDGVFFAEVKGENILEFLRDRKNQLSLNLDHCPMLIIERSEFENTPKSGTLNFLARKVYKKSLDIEHRSGWFLSFSPLQLHPFLRADAFFSALQGITIGKSEALALTKDTTFSHEYIHAFFEGIKRTPSDTYHGISPLFLCTYEKERHKHLGIHNDSSTLEELVTYFSDASREINQFFASQITNLESARNLLHSALAHATNMQNAITNVVEKLKSNSGYAADIYIFSENTVSVEIETEDKHTLTAHISPFSLAENLAKLRPTWAQRTLLNFMSYLNQTFGATFRLPLLLNFNPKFSGKAIDVTVRKLTYSLDFIEAYKEAIDTIIFITESLEKKTTQSHTERKAMQADLQTSITKLKGVIADYIYWKVPETYSPDTRIKEIKEGLPIYKYLFSAKNYSDVETIARSNILSNEAKLDLLYAQFKDTIGFENSKLYLDARNYVEKFFNSLSGQEKAQILSKRNARLLLKKLKLRVN